MKTYVEIIRGLREDRDLKQYEVAQVAGTTQQHYSRYETGESEMPIRVLIALADYYGVSTDFLTGRTACREGIDALNQKVDAGHTAGEVMSELLSLSAEGRAYALESVYLKKLKEVCESKKEKDGRRP